MKNLNPLFIIILFISQACEKGQSVEPSGSGTPIQEVINIGVIEDNFNGKNIVVYANSKFDLIVTFDRQLLNGDLLRFSLSSSEFPNVLVSTDSTVWNIFGEAVSGPRQGEHLLTIDSQMGYWFSFATFFPPVTLMGEAIKNRVYDQFNNRDWLINPDNIITGAIKDGIPALSSPIYIQLNSTNCSDSYYVNDHELVTLLKDGNTIKAYPHKILDWHEIVNDEIGGNPIAISYCPLTGTSDAWERTINGKVTTFGVSGFLYNDNLILYDRETDSLWPQIPKIAANGRLKDTEPIRVQTTEMTWAAAKTISCNIQLLSDDTGFSRNYAQYPYGTYKDVEGLLFPVTFEDSRVFGKERVLNVVIDNKAKAYRFSDFEEQ